MARSGRDWHGAAWRDQARQASEWQRFTRSLPRSRHGWVWRGCVWLGQSRLGKVGSGVVWLGPLRRASEVQRLFGDVGPIEARYSGEWSGWAVRGVVWLASEESGHASPGSDRGQVGRGEVRSGSVVRGLVRRVEPWRGTPSLAGRATSVAFPIKVRNGWVGHGEVWPGRLGPALQVGRFGDGSSYRSRQVLDWWCGAR